MNMTITRKLDALNRVEIPKELRLRYKIEESTLMGITQAEDGEIRLRKKDDTHLIARYVDKLGRIVLPPEMLEAAQIAKEGGIVFTCSNGEIRLRPEVPECRLCGCMVLGNTYEFFGNKICWACVKELKYRLQ